MPSGKGVTLSVKAAKDAGKRGHMEDYFDVRLASDETLKKLPALREQAFVGVFDGHGGKEAALYARERLWDLIQEQTKFRSTDRQTVMKGIEEAYWALHREMEPLRKSWKRNKLGDLSTAGTTACTVIFRPDHFFVANVGDSSVVLATVNERAAECGQPPLLATMLSKDHKPEDPSETERVENLGGQVNLSREGVSRVVWERKKNKDPDRPPTIDHIPFLNVSRSLGDYWSWSDHTQQFVVSPHPDVNVHTLDVSRQRFVVLASDGLWNVMSPQDVVDFVWEYETREREDESLHHTRDVVRALIEEALFCWRRKGMFADNIAVVIAFLRENTPSFGGSLSASSSQPVKRGEAESTIGSANTAADSEKTKTAMAKPPARVNHTTRRCSTLYLEETLTGGTVFEEQAVMSLHSHHKDKERGEEEEERKMVCSCGSLEEEQSPVKRQRLERTPLPRKKSHQERVSGCDRDGGSPTTEVVTPGASLPAEVSSSGVLTNSPETNLLPNPSSSLSPPLLS